MAISRKLAELFYEVRAKTSGFEADLKSAEKSAERLGSFIKAHPVAAAGALGTALIGVAYQATQMANEVEKGMTKVKQSVAGTADEYRGLKNEIKTMSLDGPRTQAQLASVAAEIGRQGVKSIGELQERLGAATRLADATGADINSIVGGMDQVFDLFGDRIGSADSAMTRLWATARGKGPIEDLFAALEGAAPAIQDLKLDFDTATRALAALMDTGLTAKKAGSELAEYGKQGREGAAMIQRLADSTKVATDATEQYNKAIKEGRETAEASWQTIKNNLSGAMIDLGDIILPKVTAGFRGLVNVLRELNGTADRLRLDQSLKDLIEAGKAGAGADVAGRARAAQGARNALADGRLDLSKTALKDLQAMQLALGQVIKGDSLQRESYRDLALAITKAIAARRELTEAEAKAGEQPKSGGGAILTAAQLKAKTEATEAAAEAAFVFAKKSAEARREVAKLMQDATKADKDARHEALKDLRELQRDASEYLAELTMRSSEDMLKKGLKLSADLTNAGDKEAGTKLFKAIEHVIKLQDALKKAGVEFGKVANSEASMLPPLKSAKEIATEQLDKARDLNRTIVEAAQGALDLANAFGLMDDKTANVLENIVQVASGINPLLKSLDAFSAAGKPGKSDYLSVVGAALPVVGGVAQLVSGLLKSGDAAAEAAQRMKEAAERLSETFRREAMEAFANDADRRRMDLQNWFSDQVQQIYDLARASGKQLGSGILTATPGNLTPTGFKGWEAIDEMINALIEAAKAKQADLEKQLAREKESLESDVEIRSLRAHGKNDEAEIAELLKRQKDELQSVTDSGLLDKDPAARKRLEEVQGEERKALEDAIAKRKDEEAKRAAAEKDAAETDANARRLAAEGHQEAADQLRREAQQRQELEAATDPAIKALIELAQAAENAAVAAGRAAAAQAALEDLNVRLLRAQGQDVAADDLSFTLSQKRELEEAAKKEMSQEYIDLLKKVQEAERAKRAAGAAGAAAAAENSIGAAAARAGGTGVSASSIQNITITQADRIVGLLGTIAANTHELAIIRAALAGTRQPNLTPPALPSTFTVGAGGQVIQNHFHMTFNFYGPVEGGQSGGRALGRTTVKSIRDMNAGLGNTAALAALGTGDVSR